MKTMLLTLALVSLCSVCSLVPCSASAAPPKKKSATTQKAPTPAATLKATPEGRRTKTVLGSTLLGHLRTLRTDTMVRKTSRQLIEAAFGPKVVVRPAAAAAKSSPRALAKTTRTR